jgi:pimeloyl-ACP methyl ester carboxylesterase
MFWSGQGIPNTNTMLIRYSLLFLLTGLLGGFGVDSVRADCVPSSEAIAVGSGVIHYDRAGIGPPLILLHGLFAQKDQWRTVLCILSTAGFDVIAPDLPGFGQSKEYPIAVYDLERQVILLEGFIDALDIEKFSLGGNSMGGAIAALYTGRHPGNVQHLAFIGPPLGLVPWGPRVRQAILQGVNPFIPLDDTQFELEMALLFVRPPEVPDEVRDSLIHDYSTRYRHYQQVWNIINLFDTVLHHIPREPRFDEIPALILWGESDAIYPVAGAELLHKRLSNSRLIILPKTGHLPMMEKPADTGEHLIRFLQVPTGYETPSAESLLSKRPLQLTPRDSDPLVSMP